MTEKWIQKALLKKGLKGKLHKKFGVPERDSGTPSSYLKKA